MERIIIDTDLGVDDAAGIALALENENVKVEGLTTVSSIGGVAEATTRATKVLKACNREDVSIYRGANHPLQRDISKVAEFKEKYLEKFDQLSESDKQIENEVAVDYMIRMVTDNPGEITIVAMGSLTNLAIAIQKDESFAKNVKKVIVCGGAEFGGNCTPVAEFNFWGDPHAARKVFEAGIQDITMIGLDATRQIVFGEGSVDKLKDIENEGAKLVYELLKVQEGKSETEAKTSRGMIDGALSIAYLIMPEVITTKEANVSIEIKGISVGQSIVDVDGLWNDGVCNCHVADKVDSDAFNNIIQKRFN